MNQEIVFKEYDLTGMKPFAKGGTADVYRLDEDKVLKLYYDFVPVETIIDEKYGARKALVAGINTAISYEMVKVGERRGIIFEAVDAKTVSEIVQEDTKRAYEMGKVMAQTAKVIHEADVPADMELPRYTESFRAAIKDKLEAPDQVKANMLAFLDQMDEYSGFVHGDFHTNNVMIFHGEPILIDIGTFAIGCPMFDLATCYFTFIDSPARDDNNFSDFTGLYQSEHEMIWKGILAGYFGADSLEEAINKSPEARLIQDIALIIEARFVSVYAQYASAEYTRWALDRIVKRFA